MSLLGDEAGQATAETLGLVPLVVAAAVGLGASGVWVARCEQLRGRVAAAAVAVLQDGGSRAPADGVILLRGRSGVSSRTSGGGRIGAILPAVVETIRWPSGVAG